MIDTNSVDYSSSMYGSSSHVSESVESASVASWQQEEQERPESNSSSWFRFGSKKNAPSSPFHEKPERRMSAVCEEPEDDLVEELQFPKAAVAAASSQDVEDERGRDKSWFAFRRSKSPSQADSGTVDDLDHSRSHAARELARLRNVKALPVERNLDEQLELAAAAPEQAPTPSILESSSNDRSSSWFSKIRRAKSPTVSKMAASVIETTQQTMEPTESTYAETDEDWLQEVMDKKMPARDDGSIEEEATNSGSSPWFRFMRSPRSPETTRSRLPSLENEYEFSSELQELQMEPGESLEEDLDVWVGEKLSDADSSHWADSIFASRTRVATESTIPSIATDDFEDDLSRDILIGMEQNLAFLNI